MDFSSRLKQLRKEKGMSQRELARALSFAPSTLAMWESNARMPDAATLEKLSEFFGVGIDYLLGRTDVRTLAVKARDKAPISDQAQIKKINERGEVVETREARNDIPPDILEELRALDVDTRTILFRSKKKLSPEGWRTVIEFIKWQLSQEENKKDRE